MALIDVVLGRIVRRGRLEVVYHDGTKATFGEPADGFPNIAIRFADGKVARDILLDPRLGAAEAFMDGRLIFDSGDIMQHVGLLRRISRGTRVDRFSPRACAAG